MQHTRRLPLILRALQNQCGEPLSPRNQGGNRVVSRLMPSRLPLKAPERDPDRARNLSHAAEIIARLKRQIPNSSAEFAQPPAKLAKPFGDRPIRPADPQPVATPNPDPSKSPDGYPGATLSTMPPKLLQRLLEEKSTEELQRMLSAENSKSRKLHDPSLAFKIYSEIKKRR